LLELGLAQQSLLTQIDQKLCLMGRHDHHISQSVMSNLGTTGYDQFPEGDEVEAEMDEEIPGDIPDYMEVIWERQRMLDNRLD
jgi:hypothetical protein